MQFGGMPSHNVPLRAGDDSRVAGIALSFGSFSCCRDRPLA
jgi:hypothetical protein